MSGRTRIGIVEWARRARGARALELRLAEMTGRGIPSASGGAAKAALAAAARRHGWHAELWDAVVPVLHDRDDELASIDAPSSFDDLDVVTAAARLTDSYRAWRTEASHVADAPVMRVLDLVLREHGAGGP